MPDEQKIENIPVEIREASAVNFENGLRLQGIPESEIVKRSNEWRREWKLPTLAEKSFIEEIRTWIQQSAGEFQNKDLMFELDIPKNKKGQVSVYLNRFAAQGFIRRARGNYGRWRRIEKDIMSLDFVQADVKSCDITMPLAVDKLIKLRPGDIAIVAGSTDAGKTAFLFNIIADNQHRYDIHYFNSEMSPGELRERLELFDDMPFSDWNFKAYKRNRDFEDVIVPGPGKLNIIDYIELYEDFYRIGEIISNIWEELHGAIGIIALQKNPGQKVARGGWGSADKSRLYLSMESGSIEIIKGKNWATKQNPDGLVRHFKLVNGCKFIPQDEWNLSGKSQH